MTTVRRRRGRPGRWLAGLMLLLAALLVAVVPVGPWLVVTRAIEAPEAILVLGSHEHERLPHAAALAGRWPRAVVWLTEPVVATIYNCQDCGTRVQRLVQAGVPEARVRVLVPRVHNTYDELLVARQTAREQGVRRLLIVTSPYHARRTLGMAAAVAPAAEVGLSPCPVEGGLRTVWWSRRYDRRYVVYELAAMAANSWRHGIPVRTWVAGTL